MHRVLRLCHLLDILHWAASSASTAFCSCQHKAQELFTTLQSESWGGLTLQVDPSLRLHRWETRKGRELHKVQEPSVQFWPPGYHLCVDLLRGSNERIEVENRPLKTESINNQSFKLPHKKMKTLNGLHWFLFKYISCVGDNFNTLVWVPSRC